MNTKRHFRWIILSMVLLAALLLGSFQVARAATNRYVDGNIGVDFGDCSNNLSPCLTISYAVSQSIAGDTIYVAAGTYGGNISIDKSLTLLGDPGDASAGPGPNAPIVDGGSAPGDAFFIKMVSPMWYSKASKYAISLETLIPMSTGLETVSPLGKPALPISPYRITTFTISDRTPSL